VAGPETGPGAIHLVGIAKTYPNGTIVLRDVDLHVARAETVSLLGRRAPAGRRRSGA